MRIIVLGAGIVGLCSSIELALAGHQVSIVAASTPPATTSNHAGAIWLPLLNSDPCEQPAEYEERLAQWTVQSWHRLDALWRAPGIRHIRNHELFRMPVQPPERLRKLLPNFIATNDSQLPAGFNYRWTFTTFALEPPLYLPWLVQYAFQLGVDIRRQEIDHLQELMATRPDAIINCSGLGSRVLCNDESLRPVKGQLLLHDPISNVDAFGSDQFGVLPRSDALVLGSLFLDHFDNATPTDGDSDTIWNEISRWERTSPDGIGLPPGVIERSHIRGVSAALRPYRSAGIRLELLNLDGIPLVHNYGHGGSGFTLSWGCAAEVVRLVSRL